MAVAKLTSKGQLVIPQAIRQHLHLQQGDSVDFIILWTKTCSGRGWAITKRVGATLPTM